MADPIVFFNNLKSNVNQLVTTLQLLNTYQDMLAQDATLADAAAKAGTSPNRTLTAQDITNVADAINQILFAFNSGSPTQKSYFYKIQ
jgi:hypothetical protein